MIFIYIILFFIFLGFVWHFTTLKFIQPWRLYFYFGKKGCGKSTLLTKMAINDLKKGKIVYSTEDIAVKIRDKKTHKTYLLETIPIEPNIIYSYTFVPNSVIYIDEASLLWSNRDFKKMDKRIVQWFQLQRKYKVTVHLFSVSFDIDKKIRDLCDEMYICNKVARVWSVARHVVRKPVIVHPSGDAPSTITDDIIEDGLLLAPFGGMKITFIPHWVRYFDSFKSKYSFNRDKEVADGATDTSGLQ